MGHDGPSHFLDERDDARKAERARPLEREESAESSDEGEAAVDDDRRTSCRARESRRQPRRALRR